MIEREHEHRALLSKPHMELDVNWVEYVNTPMKKAELYNNTKLSQQASTIRS